MKSNRKRNNNKNTKKTSKNNVILDENKVRLKDEIYAISLLALGVFLALSFHTNFTGAVGTIISNILKGLFGIGSFILAYIFILYGVLIFIGITKPINKRIILLIITMFTSIVTINGARFVENMSFYDYSIKDIYNFGIELKNGGLIGNTIASTTISLVGKVGLYLFFVTILIISFMLCINRSFSSVVVKTKSNIDDRKEKKEQKKLEYIHNDNINQNEYLSKDVIQFTESIKEEEKAKNLIELVQNDKQFGISNKNKRKKLKRENINLLDNPYDTNKSIQDTPKINLIDNDKNFDIKNTEEIDNPFKDDYISQSTKYTEEIIEEDEQKNKEAQLLDDKIELKNTIYSENDNITYRLPPLSLLHKSDKKSNQNYNTDELNENIKILENTLRSFNVDAKVINVTKGSSITRYEIQPAIGVKVAKIVNLSDDIALNLKAKSIRIEAPIPGKAAVGIEVENAKREMVRAIDIIGSKEFENQNSEISFAVGKDIAGKAVVADLAKMPHMLIAGATGAGKSVCINTIISSILYRANPDEVKLILIDPKMVELGNYNGIPHLLIPVVTDSNKAAGALNWAVSEMMQRYKKFASKSVRDIKSYNAVVEKEEGGIKLPKIVIIIDELADLMMVASSQVEQAIARLAQLARAAGMHLIVATQRPSVDVVTGLIKANIPTRIAFMVSSQIDSRTILDMAGAEKLVGNGDMLFKAQDMDKPMRIQGPYISDEEVHNIIEFVKNQNIKADYDNNIIQELDKEKSSQSVEIEDELLDEAIELVLSSGQGSASMLQRRFRIGYNRAARMIDAMEELGIISEADGAKPRTVNMTLEEYLLQKNQDNSTNENDNIKGSNE